MPWPKLRIQDLLLALAFGALIYLTHDQSEMWLMIGIAVLQLLEGRIARLSPTWGIGVSVGLQLILGYLLVGITGGVQSPYYLVLLLPIVSTASFSGVAGTIVSAVIAIGSYLSFLLFINWAELELDPEALHVLAIRCLLPAIAAILVNSVSQATREANRNLLKAEAAVRRSDRLAALGQLSAGLAHEIRNPLASIKGSAELLARSSSQLDPMAKELVGIISAEVDRTNSLVTRFLDFARPLEPRRERTDVTKVIDKAAERAHVNPERHYSTTMPEIPIDVELMGQVFLNLLTNAAQASVPGAPIRVTAKAEAGQAVIAVADHGCGIPKEKMDTIFNPFVTTKHDGVGLGLAIVSKIIDGHGGKMTVESEPGKGSTFTVFLPLAKST
jgi:two-component system sensor histidine kinase HydH